MSAVHRSLGAWSLRAVSFVGGVAILYHEVWVSDTGEPLFVIVALWLCGAPVADLLDKLRKLAVPSSESTGVETGQDGNTQRDKPKGGP